MAGALCNKCGVVLDKVLIQQGAEKHPTCEPRPPLQILAEDIGSDIKDIIRWTDNNSSRSLQTSIGPSELGDACERRIAYRLAGVPEVNQWSDPWPAIVGTAIHSWLEQAIGKFQAVHHMDRWVTESTVVVDDLVSGHVDLFDRELHTVIDFKTMSPTKLKEFKSKGPSESHLDQINLYGLGMVNAGEMVKFVSLVALPRSGWLGDMQVWTGVFDPDRARRALARMYEIGGRVLAQGGSPDFESIPAVPSRGCSFCAWYRGGAGPASEAGCPGNSVDGMEKFNSGLVA